MKGFFRAPESIAAKARIPLVAQCSQCGLYRSCKSPKMPVSGEGRRGILIVGEAPGKNEDDQNLQFVGDAGDLLEKSCRKFGIDMRRDCWITNAAICHPDRNLLPKNAVKYCRPNLVKAVNELKPSTIILLGQSAVDSLIGWVWREGDVGPVSRWDGWAIPCQRLNAWVCPTWHPSYVLRGDGYGVSQRQNDVRRLFFERHLEAAFKLEGRPWGKAPDHKSKVQIIMDFIDAGDRIRAIQGRARPIAFDYETNMLKPDSDLARIVCCSVSDGETTIAYPWHGDAIEATKDLLRSPLPKIASNMKFEARWSMAKLGIRVKNWAWDTMLGAHVLDNRDKIASIKFQAFVLLGEDAWDTEVKPYLKAKGGGANDENRIVECDLNRLLRYCGHDSLMEWKVAHIQAEKMGMTI